MSKICAVADCGNAVKARELCNAHYMRFRKTGELVSYGQPMKERGIRRDHPHYKRWCKLSGDGKLCERWKDFKVFVADIGDGAGRKKLQRPDQSKPYGPDNFRWAEPHVGERKNAYYREWYKNNPTGRNGTYQRRYGITLDEYNAMLAKQNGGCAICKRVPEGEDRRLAIDHVHNPDGSNGPVRALLCSPCNTMLGLAGDDRARLIAAIQYLDRHFAANEDAA